MAIWRPGGFFLVPAMMLVSVAVFGQRKANFNARRANFNTIEFGVGPSMVSIFDNDSRTLWTSKVSGALDIGVIYAVKRKLAVTAHAMLERKGGKLTDRSPGVETPEQKFNVSSTYISFVPGVRRYLGDGGVFVEGGMFVGFLLGSNVTPVATGSLARAAGPYASIDAGVSGSVGVTPYRTQLKGWNFRLVNNLGISDANQHTGTKEVSNSLSLIIGTRIRMR